MGTPTRHYDITPPSKEQIPDAAPENFRREVERRRIRGRDDGPSLCSGSSPGDRGRQGCQGGGGRAGGQGKASRARSLGGATRAKSLVEASKARSLDVVKMASGPTAGSKVNSENSRTDAGS